MPYPAINMYEKKYFVDTSLSVWNYSLFSDDDIANFQGGTHYSLYHLLGNHPIEVLDKKGTYFAVWAPDAQAVNVIGDLNQWDKTAHALIVRKDGSGIWEGFIPGENLGSEYKYLIQSANGDWLEKADPFAHYWALRPSTSTRIWQMDYQWNDVKWMKRRHLYNSLESPFSVYEVHLASWMRPDKNNEDTYNTYRQMIELMVPYVQQLGFTHVEIMPVMEYPFDGSWGYQGLGYFAPTSRFGTPQDFMALVDAFHQANIGVILDWVPSHFPEDAHGLFRFDGSHVYEYADMRKGFHPDWNSYIFNYGRGEVKSFLSSSARFWCDVFHADGLRVDAVSSILKLDYSRKEGEWERNSYGGNGNLEAIQFLQDLNAMLYRDFPDIQMIAEESTDWPGISRPLYVDGLGFGMKWMLGWMHDTLDYFHLDERERGNHQDSFTFSMMYFYDENFMLPFSHDEVVHGKSPMLYKMPGDEWKKFANLRLMYTYMYLHPGGKLLFMGSEFGSTSEWDYKSELPWQLLEYKPHRGLLQCVVELNHLLKFYPSLFEKQFDPSGFEWLDLTHPQDGVIAFLRKGKRTPSEDMVVLLNMKSKPRWNWKIKVKGKSQWREIFNSDKKEFDGTGDVYNPLISSTLAPDGGYELTVHLPPLAGIVLI